MKGIFFMSVNDRYEAWLSCPAMTDELLSELHSMDEDTRIDAFYRDLTFGTGGLRGVLGAGTNRMNIFTVMKATRGLGLYLLSSFSHPSCAVSCDSRIHSRAFVCSYILLSSPHRCSVLQFVIFLLLQA